MKRFFLYSSNWHRKLLKENNEIQDISQVRFNPLWWCHLCDVTIVCIYADICTICLAVYQCQFCGLWLSTMLYFLAGWHKWGLQLARITQMTVCVTVSATVVGLFWDSLGLLCDCLWLTVVCCCMTACDLFVSLCDCVGRVTVACRCVTCMTACDCCVTAGDCCVTVA